MERRADLPEAFQPAMLATLEKQCRDFFRCVECEHLGADRCSSYVENHMNEAGIQILDLDDLAPLGKTKRVAALAFVRLYSNECEQTLTGGSFSTTA